MLLPHLLVVPCCPEATPRTQAARREGGGIFGRGDREEEDAMDVGVSPFRGLEEFAHWGRQHDSAPVGDEYHIWVVQDGCVRAERLVLRGGARLGIDSVRADNVSAANELPPPESVEEVSQLAEGESTYCHISLLYAPPDLWCSWRPSLSMRLIQHGSDCAKESVCGPRLQDCRSPCGWWYRDMC